MSRVMTFSRQFPGSHPRAGEATAFVEKIWEGMNTLKMPFRIPEGSGLLNEWADFNQYDYTPKYHTIRAGNRYKVGDWFSPRVWSGKPYNSKQIIIAPDIQVKKVWNFKFFIKDDLSFFSINKKKYRSDYRRGLHANYRLLTLATNDGLGLDDFMEWFKYPKPFSGQIICWNENIEY